jgi:hypothetical protein
MDFHSWVHTPGLTYIQPHPTFRTNGGDSPDDYALVAVAVAPKSIKDIYILKDTKQPELATFESDVTSMPGSRPNE